MDKNSILIVTNNPSPGSMLAPFSTDISSEDTYVHVLNLTKSCENITRYLRGIGWNAVILIGIREEGLRINHPEYFEAIRNGMASKNTKFTYV